MASETGRLTQEEYNARHGVYCENLRPARDVVCQKPKGHDGKHMAVIFWEGVIDCFIPDIVHDDDDMECKCFGCSIEEAFHNFTRSDALSCWMANLDESLESEIIIVKWMADYFVDKEPELARKLHDAYVTIKSVHDRELETYKAGQQKTV